MKKILLIALTVLLTIACNKKPKEKIELLPYGESEITQGTIVLVLGEVFEFTIANSSIDTYLKVEDFRVAELNSYQDESGQKVYVITPNNKGKTYLTVTDYKDELKFEINVKMMTISYSLNFTIKQNSGVLEITPLVSNLPKNCENFLLVLGNSKTDKVLDFRHLDRQQLEIYQSSETAEVMFRDTLNLQKKNQDERSYELSLYALTQQLILPSGYSYSELLELLEGSSIFSCMVAFTYTLADE